MSRLSYDGDWDDSPTRYLWNAWSQAAQTSKASIKRRQFIEDALLALPTPTLCEDYLFEYGQVCAVGAVVAYYEALKAKKSVPALLAEWGEDDGIQGEDDECETVWAGEAAGLPRTIAWLLMEMNDETCAGMTPEDRYTTLLDGVRGKKRAAMERHGVAA